jgi:hypothetical protein
MTRLRLTIVGFVAAAGLAVAPAALSDGGYGPGNNVVIAETSTNGAFVPNSALQIAYESGDKVDNSNVAYAHAFNCDGCHASAVAVQVVLVQGKPSTITPGNGGAAVNENCTGCGTYAYAWQYVLITGKRLKLDEDARARIAGIRRQIAATTASIVPTDAAADGQLDSKLNSLTAQLKAVIDEQASSEGQHGHGDVHVKHYEAAGR